jgi:formate dehydrogenase subunit delta
VTVADHAETPASLVRMANQIASNADHKDHERAVALVTEHLRDFWAPSMRERLTAYVDAGGEDLTDVARTAIDRLR